MGGAGEVLWGLLERRVPKVAEGSALWIEHLRKKEVNSVGWEGFLIITRYVLLFPAVTSSDCYVTLDLPTASSHTLQTRTVKNSRNPVWNQSFHFRIHRLLKVAQARSLPLPFPLCPLPRLLPCLPLIPSFLCKLPLSCLFQNVVELKVFDQDLLTKDDPVLSVLFDVGTLRAGESRRQSFSLSTQVKLCAGEVGWGAVLRIELQRLPCFREWLGPPRRLFTKEQSCLQLLSHLLIRSTTFWEQSKA